MVALFASLPEIMNTCLISSLPPYPARSTTHPGTNTRICAAVFIYDTAQKGILSAVLLKTLYERAPSEIRMAESIVDGLAPAEAETRFNVSINTTRNQLRSLFAKTDTQRQADDLTNTV